MGHVARIAEYRQAALAIAQRAHILPKRLGPPFLLIPRHGHTTSGLDVYLFTGCVMDAWQRHVHHAAQRVLAAAGFGVT